MKRGQSGLSMVLPLDKPKGMSSHDVVNRVRGIFGERRVGHAGTLDPFASGVLPILVGPATRLDKYMTSHDKRYAAQIKFGFSTTTDDCEGEVKETAPPPARLLDESYARETARSFLGRSRQVPPAYSAIKVNGKKACDEARRGRILDLEPRDIEVYEAELQGIGEDGAGNVVWDVDFKVSKGTYIRALARDFGVRVKVPSHLASLSREQVGSLGRDACVTLEALGEMGAKAAIDPVRLLGFRILFADAALAGKVANGGFLDVSCVELFECLRPHECEPCLCSSGIARSVLPPSDGEFVSVVAGNKLSAIYRYCGESDDYRPDCVFQAGVSRGSDI